MIYKNKNLRFTSYTPQALTIQPLLELRLNELNMKKFILLSVITIISGISLAAQNSLNDKLVAYYPFCGNLEDKSGNENHGVAHGGHLAEDFNANANSAYYFNGIDDMIKINDSEHLYLSGDFTLSAWVYPLERKTQMIVRKGSHVNGAYTTPYALAFSQTNDVIFSMYNGTELVQARHHGYNLNTWTLVTGVFKDGFMFLYVNGVLVANKELRGIVIDDPQALLIGTRLQLPSSTFKGRIDEVRIWDRGLMDEEIEELYTMDYNNLPALTTIEATLCGDQTLEIYGLEINEEGTYFQTISTPGSCSEGTVEIRVVKYANPMAKEVTLDCTNTLNIDTQDFDIRWSDGQSGNNYHCAESGWYFYSLDFHNACTISDSIYIELTNEAQLDFLGDDIISCEHEITISSPHANTTWSTGETGANITIDENMIVTASYLTEDGCIIEDNVNVIFDRPSEGFLGDDIVSCGQVNIITSPYQNTRWPDGSIGSEYKVSESTEIEATAISDSGCERTDIIFVEMLTPIEVNIPNLISRSQVSTSCFNILSDNNNTITALSLSIYDLSGRMVFQTKDIDYCWNITDVLDGMYVYNLEMSSTACNGVEFLTGKITVFE